MVTAGTEPAVIPLTEVDVLFSKVREKPILILLTLLHEGPLHCVCISYVSFMWEKKRCCGPFYAVILRRCQSPVSTQP